METLKGKVALVTGVGRKIGIGAAICRELAKNGTSVFFAYWHQYDIEHHNENREENPSLFTEELEKFGVRAKSLEIDLSKPDSPQLLVETVLKEFGTIYILINNAAVSTHQPFQEVAVELLDEHYAVNVRSATLLCKEFTKQAKQGGKIINLTSGQELSVMEDELPYTITKASVEMLTKQLAPELLEANITINAIDPGPTDTGWMTQDLKEQIIKDSKKGKINTPEDTAQLIISLLQDDSGKTGQVIHVEW